ncbi:chorismate mutase [Candidatus Woesearchaeota archaeon]|nr:chorismate mutase [Candidatus Woesearchaeota archaeon]MBW3005671.1 chorismate mutase [Candidatus Woesearchaeota archaeon]
MIDEYRKEIDLIDSEIISLLEKREILVEKIKEIKLQQKIPLEDKEREQQVLKKAGKFKKVFKEVLK